jgi:hypothetical protein
VPQQGHVIDRVSAGDHPRDQRRDLQVSIPSTTLVDPNVLGHKILQARAFGKSQDRRETRARHQVRVIELDREAMAQSHLPDALLRWSNLSLEKIDSPATEGHLGFATRCSSQAKRWIRA